jgi:competence protein ComEC
VRNIFAAFLTKQRGRFALFLPVFMGAGILAYFGRASEPSLAWSVAGFGVPAAAGLALRGHQLGRAPALCAAFAAAGVLLACLATLRAPGWIPLPRHAAEVSGRIAAIDILAGGRRVTLLHPSLDGGAPLPRALRIRLRGTDQAALAQGDEIVLRALLQMPAPPDYPGGWDTQRDAFFSGLGGYGFAIGPVRVLHRAGARALESVREAVAARIMAGLPGPQGPIAATLLTGIDTAIPLADRAAYEASGLAHLLAVAGLHIGIVMGLAFFAARLGLAAWEYAALAWPTRQLAALLALAAGFVYLELTGAHLPILRSFGMAALVTLGVLTGRRAISLRGLALAATVLMAVSPVSVMGVSFQMSFSAVLCLIAGYEMARPVLRRMGEGRWWRRAGFYAAGLVLSSFLAGTASAPFAAYHFGRVGLYYVPANMLAVPLAAFWVMPWGLAALLLMPLRLEWLALPPMGWGIEGLTAIAHAVAAWPDADMPVGRLPSWSPVLVAAGLAWGGLWRGRLRLVGAAPILAGLLGPLLMRPPDVFVAPEAALIALDLGGRIFAQGAPSASGYELQAPLRLWGAVAARGLASAPAGLVCDAAACRAGRILILRDSVGVACDAAVIVSATWLHGACPDRLVIDHAYIEREGATLIWLTASGANALTARTARGARPWVISDRVELPMAQAE